MRAEHFRATELVSGRPDRLTAEDRSWLSQHLQDCSGCRDLEAGLSVLGTVVRSEPTDAPPMVVSRTKAAMRRRIAERSEVAVAQRLMAASVGFATMVAAAYGMLAWATVALLGRLAGLSPLSCWVAYATLWTLLSLTAAITSVAMSTRPSSLASVSGIEGDRP